MADDLEERQYGNICGEEGYSLLEGSLGSIHGSMNASHLWRVSALAMTDIAYPLP